MKLKKKFVQKLYGLLAIAAGVGSIFIEYDITVSLFMVPMGLFLLLTKEIVIA